MGNAVAQIGGGGLAWGIVSGFEKRSYPGWKVMFLLAGGIAVFYGVGMLVFFPDSPLDARWLNDHDRHVAVERLRANQQGIGSKVFKWHHFREAITDSRTWLYCLFCILNLIPCSGFTVFFGLLIRGYGFTSKTSLLLSMPSGAVRATYTYIHEYMHIWEVSLSQYCQRYTVVRH